MLELFGAALGEDLVQLSFLWCHRVAEQRGASGLAPACGKAEKAGGITVWLPLTDATPENGGMLMLPRGAWRRRSRSDFSRARRGVTWR